MNPIPLICALLAPLALSGAPTDEDGNDAESGALWFEDEAGLRQWKAFDEACSHCLGEGEEVCERCTGDWQPEECEECDRKQIATCRHCGGDGKELNPLEDWVCPFCDGSALYICSNCHGRGSYQVTGGSRKGQKCGPCDGGGLLKCLACKGKRIIPVVKVGRGPGEAKSEQLQRARDVLTDAQAQMRGYRATGREASDSKVFDLAIKKALGTLPALKQIKKMRDASLKALRVSAAYVSYEAEIIAEFGRFRDRTVSLLDGQIQLIDKCSERLDYNAQKEAQ